MLWCIAFFFTYRRELFEKFSGLSNGSSDGNVEVRGETEKEKADRLKEEEKEKAKNKRWNWFSFIYTLAKGDPTKFESIAKLNFVFALNFKSFESENKGITEYYK